VEKTRSPSLLLLTLARLGRERGKREACSSSFLLFVHRDVEQTGRKARLRRVIPVIVVIYGA